MNKWEQFSGVYQPLFYDLKLKSGTVVQHCWPFGGNFTPVNCTGDVYIEGSRVEAFRVSEIQWGEYQREQLPK